MGYDIWYSILVWDTCMRCNWTIYNICYNIWDVLYNISQELPHINVLFSLCLLKQWSKVSTGALQHSCSVAVALRAIGDACSLRRSDDSLGNLFVCNRHVVVSRGLWGFSRGRGSQQPWIVAVFMRSWIVIVVNLDYHLSKETEKVAWRVRLGKFASCTGRWPLSCTRRRSSCCTSSRFSCRTRNLLSVKK